MSKQQPSHAKRDATAAAQPARSATEAPAAKGAQQPASTAATASKKAAASTEPSASPAKEATPPTPVLAWANAVSRGLPYLLLEYCIFLALAEWNVAASVIVGILLMVVALAVALSRSQGAPDVFRDSVAQARTLIKPFAGDLNEISRSVLLLGAALVVWTTFHASGAGILSFLSIIVLLAALFFAIRAQYLAQLS